MFCNTLYSKAIIELNRSNQVFSKIDSFKVWLKMLSDAARVVYGFCAESAMMLVK